MIFSHVLFNSFQVILIKNFLFYFVSLIGSLNFKVLYEFQLIKLCFSQVWRLILYNYFTFRIFYIIWDYFYYLFIFWVNVIVVLQDLWYWFSFVHWIKQFFNTFLLFFVWSWFFFLLFLILGRRKTIYFDDFYAFWYILIFFQLSNMNWMIIWSYISSLFS